MSSLATTSRFQVRRDPADVSAGSLLCGYGTVAADYNAIAIELGSTIKRGSRIYISKEELLLCLLNTFDRTTERIFFGDRTTYVRDEETEVA